MGGVKVGSRLEQLRKLRDQVQVEIELEERRELLEGARTRTRAVQQAVTPRAGSLTGGVGKGSSSVLIRESLAALGVTSYDVKVWAVEQGLLPEFKRGTVAVAIIDAYEQDHDSRPVVEA